MNKKITLFIILNLAFLFFKTQMVKAQFVTIPDSNFVAWLESKYPTVMIGNYMDTTAYLIVYEDTVDVNLQGIHDLTGIQYFDKLKCLKCSANFVTSLPRLSPFLNYLDCRSNQITNLNLSNSPALAYFYCNNNQLTSLDFSNNSAIYNLECSNNQLTSLNVTNCSFISIFTCAANQLTSLDVSSAPQIDLLYCGYNQLTSLDLSSNSGIYTLSCRNNQLTSLTLAPNNTLNYFDCANNQLTSISKVPNSMNRFEINNNNVMCVNNLPQLYASGFSPAVGIIGGNPLTCVPNQTSYSLGLPLCVDSDTTNNPNGCQSIVNIAVNVFTDLNSNCYFESSDWKLDNIPVKVYDAQNNLKQISLTTNGVYSFASLPDDTYFVRIDDTALPLNMACGQANNQMVSLDSTNQAFSNINFPVVCDSAFDIAVNSVTPNGWVVPGRLHTLKTNISNDAFRYNLNCSGVASYGGTVTITLSGPVTYWSPSNGALTPTINGNELTYMVNDFSTVTPESFGVLLLVDTLAQAGNKICAHIVISPTQLDADTSNNIYDFCYQISSSYDPNMKEVYPTDVHPGYNDWFTYTIHFQNTGNALAFNVRLLDYLDTQLDINTFEFLGASHNVNTTINGRALTVRFNNIMLPDSTSDYEGSMGYYQYRVKPLPNLPDGSTIENTAYIYFDYNPAIVTNTTQNNFDITVGNRVIQKNEVFSIYPNPSTGIFTIKSASAIKTIEVFNLIGESVLQQTNSNTININNQPQGIYFCKVNGNKVLKLVKE